MILAGLIEPATNPWPMSSISELDKLHEEACRRGIEAGLHTPDPRELSECLSELLLGFPESSNARRLDHQSLEIFS